MFQKRLEFLCFSMVSFYVDFAEMDVSDDLGYALANFSRVEKNYERAISIGGLS